MHKINYEIEIKEPVIISGSSGDQNLIPTRDYIPGSMLVGALATYLSSKKMNESYVLIKKFFLEGAVKVSNAYKVAKFNSIDKVSMPTPLSFAVNKKDVGDLYNLLVSDGVPENIQTKSIGGFSIITEDTKPIIVKVPINKKINFHHKRDSYTGSTSTGVIFNYEAIEKGQKFAGSVSGEENVLSELKGLLSHTMQIHLGRSKTGQYGSCIITFSDICEKQQICLDFDEDEFILTAESDVIIYNEYGFSEASQNVFEEYMKNEGVDVKIKDSFIKSGIKEGFNSLWGMHKPSDICFKAGSVFKIEGNAEEIEKLIALISRGIGQRVNEGFGKCLISNINYNKYKLHSIDDKKEKPGAQLPESLKPDLISVYKSYLKEQARFIGILDAKNIGNIKLLSNSLVSRLYSFAVGSEDIALFRTKMSRLREKPKKTLEDIYIKDISFLQFLDKVPIKPELFNKKNDEITAILGYNIEDDRQLNDILKLTYLRAMFLYLRKCISSSKGGK